MKTKRKTRATKAAAWPRVRVMRRVMVAVAVAADRRESQDHGGSAKGVCAISRDRRTVVLRVKKQE